MNILFIGDIVGKEGRQIVSKLLPGLKEKMEIDFCIANGENAAGGFGITPEVAQQLYSFGIDIITTGNHVWDKKEILDIINLDERLLRPANYPEGVPGIGSVVAEATSGIKVGVINLCGRIYMLEIDCPFKVAKREIERIKRETPTIIVDMHAEVTSEKVAMGWYLDGSVSAVIGTHTHIPTADERVLPQGTAYVTDIGMTGPYDSVIGIKKEIVIQRFLTQMPLRFEVAQGNVQLCGVVLKVDPLTGRAESIRRIQLKPD